MPNARESQPMMLELNQFANLCGFFHNAYLTDGIAVNNGYNCRHPKQEETYVDDETGKTIGCCYGWSCPFGYPPDAEDLAKHGVISQDEAYLDEGLDTDDDFIIVDDEEKIKELRDRGIAGCGEEKEDA